MGCHQAIDMGDTAVPTLLAGRAGQSDHCPTPCKSATGLPNGLAQSILHATNECLPHHTSELLVRHGWIQKYECMSQGRDTEQSMLA